MIWWKSEARTTRNASPTAVPAGPELHGSFCWSDKKSPKAHSQYQKQQQPRGGSARASLHRPGVPRQAREPAGPDSPTQPLLPCRDRLGTLESVL